MLQYVIFASACAVQLAYWRMLRRGFQEAQQHPPANNSSPHPPVSVVVAARNEEKKLPGLLAALLRQDYNTFEIVLVDDASKDRTGELARTWPDPDRRLKLVSITEPSAPRKKNALTKGIKAASYECLVFSDADCQPPPGWLRAMTAAYTPRQPGTARRAPTAEDGIYPVLCVGYSPFRKGPGWLNRIARYETFVTGFFTAAAIGLCKPYMAVGRNLSYPKSVFTAIGGFAHSRQSLSGDDDLLVQEVRRRNAAKIIHVFDPASFVPTDAPSTWRQWLRQKTRHTSASRFYAHDVQTHLTLFHASNALLWLAPFFAGWAGAGFLALKLLQQHVILKEAAEVLQEEDLLSTQPVLELLYTAYNLLVAPVGVLKMPRRW
jgi:glycosyltransferase involved in cell wall biosynthesis